MQPRGRSRDNTDTWRGRWRAGGWESRPGADGGALERPPQPTQWSGRVDPGGAPTTPLCSVSTPSLPQSLLQSLFRLYPLASTPSLLILYSISPPGSTPSLLHLYSVSTPVSPPVSIPSLFLSLYPSLCSFLSHTAGLTDGSLLLGPRWAFSGFSLCLLCGTLSCRRSFPGPSLVTLQPCDHLQVWWLPHTPCLYFSRQLSSLLGLLESGNPTSLCPLA